MFDLNNLLDALNRATDDDRGDVLAAQLRELPDDAQAEVSAQLALHYAEIALGLINAAARTGGPVLVWMREAIADHVVAVEVARLEDELEDLGGDL